MADNDEALEAAVGAAEPQRSPVPTDPVVDDQMRLFVRLVERYLADYRTLVQQDDAVRALLIETLDVFVEAGWAEARQLTYGLHELFR